MYLRIVLFSYLCLLHAIFSHAYIINVGILYDGDPSQDLPDRYQYTVTGESDEEAYVFDLYFPVLDNYQTVNNPTGWEFQQTDQGIHWSNTAADNPITADNPLTFTLELENSYSSVAADGYVGTTFAQRLPVPVNLAFFGGPPGPGGGGLVHGAHKSKVNVTNDVVTPNYVQVDSMGSVVYVDQQGNPKQGSWHFHSVADDRDNDGKWDYTWILSNVLGPPGGLPYGNLIDYNDALPRGYPENLGKVLQNMGANRLAQDTWPNANAGGFDGLVNINLPLLPAQQATVLLSGAPAPIRTVYWTVWNPEVDARGPFVIPTPEPATYLLMASGLAALLRKKRRGQ